MKLLKRKERREDENRGAMRNVKQLGCGKVEIQQNLNILFCVYSSVFLLSFFLR